MVENRYIKNYSLVSRIIHHMMALAFIAAPLTIFYARIQEINSPWIYQLHQSLGMTVLILFFIRIIWNAWMEKPETLGPRPIKFLAHIGHFILLSLIILMPLTGLLSNMARAKETVIFGMITIPGFHERKLDLLELTTSIHSFLEIFVYMLIAIHIGAAFFHHFILRDATLKRMIGTNR